MTNKYLITGGFGFIGSNFINFLYKELKAKNESFEIHCIDNMTYASNILNVNLEIQKYEGFFHHKMDIASESIGFILEENQFNFCVNFAAESHVDRSIKDPLIFAKTNVLGTVNLLNFWSKNQTSRFIQIGTDEVYGSVRLGTSDENYELQPSSPYSSSKASADLLALSFFYTFKTDVIVTRCTNNYGRNQHAEKLIPTLIRSLNSDTNLKLYGNGLNVREWIHVDDHIKAIITLAVATDLKHRIYNIGSGIRYSNLEIAQMLIKISGSKSAAIEYISDRAGHDYRYAINSTRIRNELEWQPEIDIEEGLVRTFDFYKNLN